MNTPEYSRSLSGLATGKWPETFTDRTTGIKRGANGSDQPGVVPGSPMVTTS